ncbi:MAG: proline dehydrogenase family protein [Candidatus Limnocylindrales bacterium]
MIQLRVELLATPDCPHAERAERILRETLSVDGHEPHVNRIYVQDIDHAAGLGFRGSPTIRIDGRDVVPVSTDVPVHLGCRLYRQPDGRLDGVVASETIAGFIASRMRAAEQAEAEKTSVREVPGKLSRAFFLWASRRRVLGRFATAFPLTRAMVRRFVAGEKLSDALDALGSIREQGMTWTLDVLGESVDSRESAIAAADRYIEALDALAERGLEANVSLKLTQMGLEIDHDFCVENVARVVGRARDIGAFVRIDMEDHTKTETTLEVVRTLHTDYPEVGAVIQSYLRRSADDIGRLNGDQIRVRLCKGAYDEPASVAFRSRDEVDRSYIELMEMLLTGGRYPGLATHDEKLVDHALDFVQRNDIGPDKYEFQMLYGIRRDLQERLVRMGQTVRVYVPYGTQWYPYYMRRLAERPQNVLFIVGSLLSEGRGSQGPGGGR